MNGNAMRQQPRVRRELLTNAVSLFNTTLVNSLLGFAFWAAAARLFSQSAVGYGSAATSVMTLLGTVGMFGLGSLLIGELPRLRTGRAALTAAATIACGVAAAAFGLAFVLVAPLTGHAMGRIVAGPVGGMLLVVGVALTAASLVLDQATIGVMRGQLQLRRNVVFAVLRLLVIAVPAALGWSSGNWIMIAWVAALAFSVLAMALLARRDGTRINPPPDWARLRKLRRTAGAHNALNLAVQGPRLLLPVMVTVLVSSTANAAFYIAYMIATFLYIVPTHLSTVLFAVVAKDPGELRSQIRLTLRLSAIIGAAGVAVVMLTASPVLHLLGKDYAVATDSLLLLAAAYLPMTVKLHYIAVSRAADRIGHAAVVLSFAGALELGGAAVGASIGGLTALTAGYVVAVALEATILGATVIRAAATGYLRRGRRPATEPAGASGPEVRIQGQRPEVAEGTGR